MNSKNTLRTRLSPSAAPSGWRLWGIRMVAVLLLVLTCSIGSFAYSVLTHEEIIDLLWTDESAPFFSSDFQRSPKTSSRRHTVTPMVAPSFRTSATIPLGVWNSAI
jgi:hypothetical protein